MKNNIFNLLGSLIAFYIPVQIAYLTGSESVIKAVLLAFLIQWICFSSRIHFANRKILRFDRKRNVLNFNSVFDI